MVTLLTREEQVSVKIFTNDSILVSFDRPLSLVQNRIGIRFVKMQSMAGLKDNGIGGKCHQDIGLSGRMVVIAGSCNGQ
ncbi:MAG: hypothetical protein CO167_05730 [Candidatus Marinimicrobia bacterium CG_4_9_14_3_um_filter_48_9]|nr:MAG: hypothetical protein CO167_05730 [Candidatus Marinimicrobia bacterium CG_4_9_14_3_um_filter_48_9]